MVISEATKAATSVLTFLLTTLGLSHAFLHAAKQIQVEFSKKFGRVPDLRFNGLGFGGDRNYLG